MGKLIPFPMARVRRRPVTVGAFNAFSELDSVEHKQLKLMVACICGALLFTFGLQLAAG